MSFYPLPDLSEFAASLPDNVKAVLFSGDYTANLEGALAQLKEVLPSTLDTEYIKHVILPALLMSVVKGERPYLPMIDQGTAEDPKFSKEHALPYFLWGLLNDSWGPPAEGDSTTVFLMGYENRSHGQDTDPDMPKNMRKRIYYSALTADVVEKYSPKVSGYFETLFSDCNANQPFMTQYVNTYSNLYWDLHLSTPSADIPDYVRQIQYSFNTVLAAGPPIVIQDANATQEFYNHYMKVRELRPQFYSWLDDQIDQAKGKDDETTFVYYWLKNSDQGESPNFRLGDVRFECFHNFLALSQWGNMIYNIMRLLSVDTQDPDAKLVQKWFCQTMQGEFDCASEDSFTPLDRFVMELFRYISPNTGSISYLYPNDEASQLFPKYLYIVSPHADTSNMSAHWQDPLVFNPDRYLSVPTTADNDEARSQTLGFAQCPFHKENFDVKDGRSASVTNSIFGTVYGEVEGRTDGAVCDYAGYAPFGFGYRRCPGELLNNEVFKDFLKKVWQDKIEFYTLDLPDPPKVPVAPGAVVPDIYGFRRSANA